MIQRTFRGVALAGAILLAACGGGGSGSVEEDDDLNGGGPSAAVTVAFQSYCQGETVTVYETDPSGSSCTPVDTSGPVTPAVASPNAYSASTSGSPDCSQGTRVEITPGSDGDVSYDISTNAAVMDPPFFNVPVQFLALQNTAPSPCALPAWDGGTGVENLRGVSSQVCASATCPTAYQTPTSGPQFITRDTAASSYVVEWCPAENPSPIPFCTPPPFDATDPCPNLCWEDAVTQPFPCAEAGNVMCNTAPFGGNPPESYCLLPSDCTAPREPCGCCTSDSDCGDGESCTNFRCG
jgi:hypothetical protein